MKKRCALLFVLTMLLGCSACGGTAAQPSAGESTPSGDSGWPTRDITVVVPYSAGGGTDNTIRILQSKISEYLGVNIIVTNEPASSGAVATQSVASAQADGYTLLCTAAGAICYQNHYEGVDYQLSDFTPISRISVGPELICVRADSPIQNFDDLVKAMNESTLSFSSTAVGAAAHISLMSFCKDINATVNYVPYSSGSEAMTALLGGHTDACVGGSQQILAQLANGDIRVVANLGSSSGMGYEEVPIASENGYKTQIDTFNGILGPANLESAVVEKLLEAIDYALADEAVQSAMLAAGIEMGYMGPSEFNEYLESYNETVRAVLLETGLITQ